MSHHRGGDHERRAGIHHEAVRRGDPDRQVRPGRAAVTALAAPARQPRQRRSSPRVMICDDSAVIRGAIARMLEADPEIRVVAKVGNGQAARRGAAPQRRGRRRGARHRDAGDGRHDGAAVAAAGRPGAAGHHGLDADHARRRHRACGRCGWARPTTCRSRRPSAAVNDDAFRREIAGKGEGPGAAAAAHRRWRCCHARRRAPDRIASRRPRLPPALLAIGSSTGGPQACSPWSRAWADRSMSRSC